MTVSFVVLCASGSIIFGLLFGRLFAWWQEVKDEEQAMANASIRARFDATRYDVVDDPWVSEGYERCGTVVYDWQQAE